MAVLGYPVEVKNNMHTELMRLQGHIVGIDYSGDRAFCPKFEGESNMLQGLRFEALFSYNGSMLDLLMICAGFSDASGAAVLYEYDLLAGVHIGTLNHPNAAARPLKIPPLVRQAGFHVVLTVWVGWEINVEGVTLLCPGPP